MGLVVRFKLEDLFSDIYTLCCSIEEDKRSDEAKILLTLSPFGGSTNVSNISFTAGDDLSTTSAIEPNLLTSVEFLKSQISLFQYLIKDYQNEILSLMKTKSELDDKVDKLLRIERFIFRKRCGGLQQSGLS